MLERKCKVSDLLRDLEGKTKEEKEYSQIEKERLYRQADLYGINTKWQRIQTIDVLVRQTIEKKQQEVIDKHLIK